MQRVLEHLTGEMRRYRSECEDKKRGDEKKRRSGGEEKIR
jgi:hypothetical protein